MLPTKAEAEKLLSEAEQNNPGPWGNHSRVAAHCAQKIAELCDFHNHSIQDYIGNFDTSKEEFELIQKELAKVCYDDYDRLIQLCDSMAGSEGVMDMEERMNDVKRRYGSYPLERV